MYANQSLCYRYIRFCWNKSQSKKSLKKKSCSHTYTQDQDTENLTLWLIISNLPAFTVYFGQHKFTSSTGILSYRLWWQELCQRWQDCVVKSLILNGPVLWGKGHPSSPTTQLSSDDQLKTMLCPISPAAAKVSSKRIYICITFCLFKNTLL